MSKQIKVGSKVKVYNMRTKRNRVLEVTEILEDGRLQLINCQRISRDEIVEVVSY